MKKFNLWEWLSLFIVSAYLRIKFWILITACPWDFWAHGYQFSPALTLLASSPNSSILESKTGSDYFEWLSYQHRQFISWMSFGQSRSLFFCFSTSLTRLEFPKTCSFFELRANCSQAQSFSKKFHLPFSRLGYRFGFEEIGFWAQGLRS